MTLKTLKTMPGKFQLNKNSQLQPLLVNHFSNYFQTYSIFENAKTDHTVLRIQLSLNYLAID